ncbi:hypothetical protein [Shewanella glacialimarina]|uniref:hypothetical protein n=1 Tax=Shewanella glacialimarina TaxID=2590884 RepID=UPI001CF876D8|nr:hypothetical protein [Shewanella glacialimarina]UCX06268.1 hypothetical protein FJ709_18245 [Shewanella glacialimarina]
MAGYLMNEKSSYLLIPKKYFSRYVLAYEVILSSLCAKVNQKTLLNWSDSQAVVNSGAMNDGFLLLELSCKENKNAYSFKNLEKVWFPDAELRQAFLDSSYENFNVESLDCEVVTSVVGDVNTLVLEITPPEPVSKIDFVNMMMLEDGIMALIYDWLIEYPQLDNVTSILRPGYSKVDLIRVLMNVESNDEIDISVLEHFIELCLDNGLDAGWNANEVLQQLNTLVPVNIASQKKYTQWQVLAQAFVNSENVPDKLFIDPEDGSIVLRAIILVLLNPEFSYLRALKEKNILEIGPLVYKAAKAFISLRSGFSLLNSEQRGCIGENRAWLQNLNAALHNNEFYQSETQSTTNLEAKEVLPNDTKIVKNYLISECDFLTESKGAIDGYQEFDIEGVFPNSGFRMSLLVDEHSSNLSLLLINLSTEAGKKRYKGKLALDLIQLQSSLKEGVRFEVDHNGVYLRWAAKAADIIEIKSFLRCELSKMSSLKLLNARKTTFM